MDCGRTVEQVLHRTPEDLPNTWSLIVYNQGEVAVQTLLL